MSCEVGVGMERAEWCCVVLSLSLVAVWVWVVQVLWFTAGLWWGRAGVDGGNICLLSFDESFEGPLVNEGGVTEALSSSSLLLSCPRLSLPTDLCRGNLAP